MRRLLYICCLLPICWGLARAETIEDYVSASVTAKRSEVYLGEPFEIHLTIRSHSVTLDQEFSIDPFKDSAISKLPGEASQYPVERKVMGNRIEEIRKFSWRVIGVSTGRVDFSNKLELSVLSRSTSLFFSQPKRTPFSIPVDGSKVTIRPLPEDGRPAGFSGAVGKFSLRAEVTPKEAAPGDVVRIRTVVSGDGLLEDVGPPLMNTVEGLKVYDPRRIQDDSAMVYEQQVVPQTASALTIPHLTFTYFDPATGSYETVKAGPFKIAFREHSVERDAEFRPDSEENQSTGALPAGPLSARAALTAGLCAVLMLLIAVTVLKRRSRGFAISAGCVAGAVGIIALGYLGVQKSGYFERNVFVLESQQAGLIAPAGDSVETVIIPSGGYVQFHLCRSGWALVSYSGRQCWIPESKLDLAQKGTEK